MNAYIPELFGPAPTITHTTVVGGARQPYGASMLPGAPVAFDVNDPSMIFADPSGQSGTSAGPVAQPASPPATNPVPNNGTSGPSNGTGSQPRAQIPAPTGPASDTNPATQPPGTVSIWQSPDSSPTTTQPPATQTTATQTAPATGTASSDPLQGLMDLASAMQGSSGGGGGIVALPTGLDTTGTTAASTSTTPAISGAKVALAVVIIAGLGYWYYKHKKGKKGGEKEGEKKE